MQGQAPALSLRREYVWSPAAASGSVSLSGAAAAIGKAGVSGVAAYIGWQGAFAAGETLIGGGIASAFGSEYNWGWQFVKNWGVNIATGGLGKAKSLSALSRFLYRQGVETLGDTAIDVAIGGHDLGSSLAINLVSNIGSELAIKGVISGLGRFARSSFGSSLLSYVNPRNWSLDTSPTFGMFRLPLKYAPNRHHPILKVIGGFDKQKLASIDAVLSHRPFHKQFAANLKSAGFPLNPLGGGSKNSAAAFAAYFQANPGSQRKVFDVLIRTAREFDIDNGTDVLAYVKHNIVRGNYKRIGW